MGKKANEPTPEPASAPANEPTPAPAAEPTPTPDPAPAKTYSQADFDSELKKREKAWQKQVDDANAKAKLSDDERKDAELSEARNALRERDQRDAVTDAASAAGVKNPKLFYNAYKSEFETDEKTGKITNLKDVLDAAKTEAPELFTQSPQPEGGVDGGEGNNSNNSGALTKEMIEKMSDAEIAANMDKIDAFFASGK